jgi:hypothetical protein
MCPFDRLVKYFRCTLDLLEHAVRASLQASDVGSPQMLDSAWICRVPVAADVPVVRRNPVSGVGGIVE